MCKIFKSIENVNARYIEILKDELKIFDENAENRIKELKKKILEEREKVSCGKCGSCCRLAACPSSPEDLNEKAKRGDTFAKEFINTFSLYEDLSEAKSLFPEYFDAVNKLVDKIYFYHCKLVTEDNLCPKYEDRPQICKDFPDNPLEIYPMNCSYKKWQTAVMDDILRVKAITDILKLEN